jgi:hypothetical protein
MIEILLVARVKALECETQAVRVRIAGCIPGSQGARDEREYPCFLFTPSEDVLDGRVVTSPRPVLEDGALYDGAYSLNRHTRYQAIDRYARPSRAKRRNRQLTRVRRCIVIGCKCLSFDSAR